MLKWWRNRRKKKADKSQVVERWVMHNTLTLTMKDGKNLSWTNNDWKGNGYLGPWINFYKWYFAKGSEYYVMKYNNGETMFKRADIKSFTVHMKKVKK